MYRRGLLQGRAAVRTRPWAFVVASSQKGDSFRPLVGRQDPLLVKRIRARACKCVSADLTPQVPKCAITRRANIGKPNTTRHLFW